MPIATDPFATLKADVFGVPAAEIARRFGTPTYVYEAETIGRRVADLRAFDLVRYAQKANSSLAVLDVVRRAGAMVDAVSVGEAKRAIAAGYSLGQDPPEIVYTADIFDRDSLEFVVQAQLPCNCGSADMIDQLGARMPGVPIILRVNPGFGHGHSRKTNTGGDHSKHGIWHERLGEALGRAAALGMPVAGLHMHIGSGTDMEHLGQVAGAMEAAAQKVGPKLETISAGGGLPVAYKAGQPGVDLDAYFRLWDAARKRLEAAFGHALRLEIEPGRYLVAEAGALVAEVRAVKRVGGNTFVLLDAGFNNLARPILYGSYHPMALVPMDGDFNRPEMDVVVGGPLCESGDIFTQDEGGYVGTRRLPEARVGDLLLIERAGAYGFAMGSNYNGKPLAAEVLVRGGRPTLCRARQGFEDLVRGEVIPPLDA